MPPANSTCGSADGFDVDDIDEAMPESSPTGCQHQNQLGHWDWAGRPHPNLPECCRPAVINGYVAMVSDYYIPANDGKISVQQYINSCTHKVLQQMTTKV